MTPRSGSLRGLLAAACAVAGCAAVPPPVHFHTLLAPASEPAVADPAGFLIDVLPVGIPPQLDQPYLVVHLPDGGITMPDNERWTGPLADEVRSAVSAELTRRLGTRDVAGLPRPAGRSVLRMQLQVRRLDATVGREVQLDADWSVGSADDAGAARRTCGGRFTVAAPGGYAELVRAEQRALADLAGRIAADLRAWGVSPDRVCRADA